MAEFGEMFPEHPRNLEQLVDSLVRRMSAAQRLLSSLTESQRQELSGLMSQTLEDAGLAAEMARLADALRSRRPDMDLDGWPGDQMSGQEPLGLGDATTALAELADLAELEDALRQDYPGARLDDIDEDAVRRALGRQAVDDMEALRQIERELERQGYLERSDGKLELTPKAVRRLGETALRRVFADLPEGGHGDHDQHDAGQAAGAAGRPLVRLSVGDFEVGETERRAAAAVCLLVDLSYSMALRGTWSAAKQTALALHALVRTRYPQDSIQVIGFSNYARELRETDLAGLGWDMVQGTNLHHALVLAG